ncbi:MAG: UDP-N-acetylmuramoyl-L-alanine--D-glutamate ligase, partial [Candidatus Portnoybacteria bacterium]|nr:UDP-N-acetylmuramoyl-L-alanine--D-glutamate ligase [Candidatus Portnoybacteria bacterium]
MEIEDFKDKKITIMGIGLHGGGVGAIKFFHKIGAKITATDLRTADELKESLEILKNLEGIEFVLGEHREKDFKEADFVIKNPAVPDDSKYLKIAQEAGVKIETDIGVFFELCPGHIVGVTGSRGKSTTSTLIHLFLKTKYPDAVLAGNIRASVLEKLDKIGEKTPVVLELSSWQLAGLASHKKSPPISIITSIMPDHMNRYASMDEYIADKKVIFQFQKPEDFLILNADNRITRRFAPEAESRVYFYSAKEMPLSEDLKTKQIVRIGAYFSRKKIFFGAAKEKIADVSRIKLAGEHNLSNILAAVSAARLFDIPTESTRKVLAEFTGLEGRIQLIKEIKGVKYINDTTATIPEATIAAM